jgi:hypothetical protein
VTGLPRSICRVTGMEHGSEGHRGRGRDERPCEAGGVTRPAAGRHGRQSSAAGLQQDHRRASGDRGSAAGGGTDRLLGRPAAGMSSRLLSGSSGSPTVPGLFFPSNLSPTGLRRHPAGVDLPRSFGMMNQHHQEGTRVLAQRLPGNQPERARCHSQPARER